MGGYYWAGEVQTYVHNGRREAIEGRWKNRLVSKKKKNTRIINYWEREIAWSVTTTVADTWSVSSGRRAMLEIPLGRGIKRKQVWRLCRWNPELQSRGNWGADCLIFIFIYWFPGLSHYQEIGYFCFHFIALCNSSVINANSLAMLT